MTLEFEPPEAPKWKRAKKVFEPIWKAYVWIRNRRAAQAVSSAIANNQIAVAALAASVGAAAVGGVATYSAHQANEKADQQQQRVADLEYQVREIQNDVLLQGAGLAQLNTQVADLKKATADDFGRLSRRLDTQSASVSALAAKVATLPQKAETAALARDIAALAKDTQAASKEAEKAAQAAAEAKPDGPAREAAAKAAADARAAHDKAVQAERVAQQALDRPIPTPSPYPTQTPGYEPFPRYIRWVDDVDSVNGLPFDRNFTVDLPAGQYRLTLRSDVTTQPTQPWAGRLSGLGVTAPNVYGVGNGELVNSIVVTAPGGTATFNVWMDAHVPGPGNITWGDIVITIEEVES
jgi:hypothetical protein